MYSDELVPDEEPYEADEFVELKPISGVNISLTGHYCPACETLLDVSVG